MPEESRDFWNGLDGMSGTIRCHIEEGGWVAAFRADKSGHIYVLAMGTEPQP